MEQLPENEAQNPREKYDELEGAKGRVKEMISRAYSRARGRGVSIGSELSRLGRRQQDVNNLMEEIKGEAQEEATELNEKYEELIEKVMKTLKDLHDFEVSELGIKESNAIEKDLDKHK